MKLKKLPLGKLLIQVDKTEKSASGVFYADDNIAEEVATVLQIGKDVTLVEVGDRILFKTWAPSYYKIGDEEFAILDQEYVDGIL